MPDFPRPESSARISERGPEFNGGWGAGAGWFLGGNGGGSRAGFGHPVTMLNGPIAVVTARLFREAFHIVGNDDLRGVSLT